MTSLSANVKRSNLWLTGVALAGAAWNVFGLIQFADYALRSHASLMMKGMSDAAADVYYALPLWMTIAFAVGTMGGLAGSIALGLRRRIAVPIFALSLVGYIILYAGDVIYGVFALIPGQMAVLSMVVAFAIVLLGVGWVARRQALLR